MSTVQECIDRPSSW